MTGVTPEAWRAAGRIVERRGHRIFTRTEGDGSPLLLIHGFPTASWDWHAVWPALAARHRLLAVDLIGFGFSDKPRAFDYTIGAQADLVEAFLAGEGVTRYRILSHDYGDTVAQELLARLRDGTSAARIEAVCFLNGGLFPETHRPVLIQRLLASPLGPLLARLTTFERFAGNLRRICARPLGGDELAAMWRLATDGGGLAVMPKLIGYMQERKRFRERWVGALVNANVPLRLVDGVEDPISGAHLVARYRWLVPSADVVELPGVGHYPQIEAPDEVLAAAVDFLSRV